MPTVTGIATEFIQFTRASNATVTDSDGKVKWAAHNLLTNSESFDAAGWTKTNIVTTGSWVNTLAAPNGTTTADLLRPSTVSTTHHAISGNLSSNATVIYAVYAYAGGYTKFGIRESGSSGAYASFDLTGSGSVLASASAGSVTMSNPQITPIGGGWFRASVTFVVPSGISDQLGIWVLPDSYTTGDPAGTNWSGDGTKGIYVWGAHVYRSDLGGMQPNTSAYPMYNPTTPKNLLGFTESLTTGWTNSNTTDAIVSEVNPVGLTGAVDVAATAGNGTLLRSLGLLASPYTFSIWLKRKTGSGTVEITVDGTTYVAAAVTGTWTRFSTTLTPTAGTKTPGIRLVTSGDAVYAWGAQLSDSASLDPYVPVYGAAVTSAAYYGPRRDFDGATLACKGLLVEEQRTNLQLNSNVFGTSTFATTVVGGAAASPSGLIDASSLACTSTTGRAILSTSVTSGVVYTFSAFIKSGTNTSAYIELAGTAGSGGPVVFNLSSGTVTSGTGGAIVPAPNGFYRCSVTSTATGTGASDIRIGTGDATSKTVFVYGAQLEANASFATSYIPTTTASATRSADVAQVSTAAFPYSATEGTLVVAWQLAQLSGSPAAIHLTDVAESNRIRINAHLAGINRSTITAAGVLVDNIDTSTAATGITKYAIGGKSADYAVYRNGSAGGTSTNSGFPSGCTEMRIGRDAATGNFNGHIRQITYIPRRLSNAELQTRTA